MLPRKPGSLLTVASSKNRAIPCEISELPALRIARTEIQSHGAAYVIREASPFYVASYCFQAGKDGFRRSQLAAVRVLPMLAVTFAVIS